MIFFGAMDTISLEVKMVLREKALQILQAQIRDIKNQLIALGEAGEGEDKSSAGDKYETQREMIKQSRDILDVQFSNAQKTLKHLERIPTQTNFSVQEGALIKLSTMMLWICVPLGTLIHEGQEYQLISPDSPLFMALKGLKEGEGIMFRGKNILVERLV